MQLKVTTDYGIRIVLYTAITRETISSGELSERLGIPKSIVLKLGKELCMHGLLEITTGVKGGYRLRVSPEDITLYDIVNIFEPTIKINRCLEEDEYCSRFATKSCPLRKAYVKMQKNIEDRFKQITIESLL